MQDDVIPKKEASRLGQASIKCIQHIEKTIIPMFSILESVAFDTGYAGSAGLVPQSWVNGNGTSYIYYGAGEFDGQGSGDDFWGTV